MKKKIAYSTICKAKKKFNSNKEAELKALEIKNDSGNILYHYKCNACNGWHLTKRTEKERKSIRKKVSKAQYKHDLQYENQIKKEADYWLEKKGW